MKIKNTFITLLIILCYANEHSLAQSASTNQLGLRFGGFSGITFRHVGSNDVGLEANLTASYQNDWTMISVLAEKNIPVGKGFVFFLGAGGFAAYDYNYYYDHPDHIDYVVYNDVTWGIEGAMGIDYYIPNVPLNIGLDLRPRFSFLTRPYPWDAGLSFRYIF